MNAPTGGAATQRLPSLRGRLDDVRARVLPALVLVAAALGTAQRGGALFAVFWTLAGVLVLREWTWMTLERRRWTILPVGSLALALAGLFAGRSHPDVELAVGVVLAGAAAAFALAGPGARFWAGGGVLYAGALALSMVVLRHSFPYGREAVFWLFAVVWATDVMAYFCGRILRGPKVWARLSPSKTWSGTLGGIVCGALAGLAVAPSEAPAGPVFTLGLCLATIAQAGDFFESAVKRNFGAKDSGTLIPGHGGVMDRLDGFLVAAAVLTLLGWLRFDVRSVAAGAFQW